MTITPGGMLDTFLDGVGYTVTFGALATGLYFVGAVPALAAMLATNTTLPALLTGFGAFLQAASPVVAIATSTVIAAAATAAVYGTGLGAAYVGNVALNGLTRAWNWMRGTASTSTVASGSDNSNPAPTPVPVSTFNCDSSSKCSSTRLNSNSSPNFNNGSSDCCY